MINLSKLSDTELLKFALEQLDLNTLHQLKLQYGSLDGFSLSINSSWSPIEEDRKIEGFYTGLVIQECYRHTVAEGEIPYAQIPFQIKVVFDKKKYDLGGQGGHARKINISFALELERLDKIANFS